MSNYTGKNRRNHELTCRHCDAVFKSDKRTQQYCGRKCAYEARRVVRPGQTEKRCSCCLKVKPLDSFGRNNFTTSGLQSWCKECFSRRARSGYFQYTCSICNEEVRDKAAAFNKKRREKTVCGRCSRRQKLEQRGGHSHNYSGSRNFSGRTYAAWKRGARVRGLEWGLTLQNLEDKLQEQGGFCALTGLRMGGSAGGLYRPSLDRIDSEKGYVTGNTQFVCMIVNLMKGRLPEPEFIRLCGLIVEHSRTVANSACLFDAVHNPKLEKSPCSS